MTQFSKRFLTVGSLLRPAELLEYKDIIEHRDDIDYPFYDDLEGYKACEDKWVEYIVNKQVEHGLSEISDGEFARSLWHLDFAWGINGIRRFIADHGYFFFGDEDQQSNSFETRQDIGLAIEGKLSGHNHPFVYHWQRVKELAPEGVEVKQTIPAPSQIHQDLTQTSGNHIAESDVYASEEEFLVDFIQAYKDFLKEYAEAGATIIQIDDCVWANFADEEAFKKRHPERDPQELAQLYVDLNNEVADYAHELGLKVWAHNCRGNYASRGAMKGSYEAVANFFLKQQRYDRFFLEWDDERAGSLEALEVFKDRPEVEVVLGALSSKTSELDDAERALQMLEEASQYIPKDKLYLSHQCGFASCDCGNNLGDEEQWKKIDQGHEIAYQFFGE